MGHGLCLVGTLVLVSDSITTETLPLTQSYPHYATFTFWGISWFGSISCLVESSAQWMYRSDLVISGGAWLWEAVFYFISDSYVFPSFLFCSRVLIYYSVYFSSFFFSHFCKQILDKLIFTKFKFPTIPTVSAWIFFDLF